MLEGKIAFHNEPLVMLPPRICLTIHEACLNQTNNTIHAYSDTVTLAWTDIVNYVCYMLLPMVLFFGLLGQVINIIILTKQVRMSLDTYLLSISVISILQVCGTVILCIPYYIGHFNDLVHVQYYTMIGREWFCHIGLWLLISVSLERSVTFTLHRTYSSGTAVQAWIIMGIVTMVGLISVLPRLWEYSITDINLFNNTITNKYPSASVNYSATTGPSLSANSDHIVIIIQRTTVADSTGFAVIYFWYLTSIFVILPLVLLMTACIPLCFSADHELSPSTSRTMPEPKYSNGMEYDPVTSRYFSPQCSTNSALVLNRRAHEDIALTKLIILMIILYLVLTTPLVFLHLLASLVPNIVQLYTPLTITIQNLLTIIYHLYFVIHQQVYFCYNKQYRRKLLSMCCCCC